MAIASVIPADAQPLTEEQKAAVHSSAPALEQHGLAITTKMYQTIFEAHPALRNIFSMPAQTSGAQPVALAASLVAYAKHIHDLTPLIAVVQRISTKHAALGVKAEHYPIVADHLFRAIGDVLGPALTPELTVAWYNAYWQLAALFIDAEAQLETEAPWSGWKEFEISQVEEESPTVSSFTLVPEDKSMLPLRPYKPGQFLTVRVWAKELDCYQNRHYSLSDAHHADHYRITVKREPNGIVSNILHSRPNRVWCAFPAGTFTLPPSEHVVFISAGVGITPHLGMINTAIGQKDSPQVTWIQTYRTSEEQLFAHHMRDVVEKSSGKINTILVDSASPEGRVDLARINDEALMLESADTIYSICGPAGFMSAMARGLLARGVVRERIIMEAFRAGEIDF